MTEPYHHFTDTHCHLDFAAFDQDRDAVLAAAAERGVRRLVIPGVAANQWAALTDFQHPQVQLRWGVGLHPWFLECHHDDHLVQLEAQLRTGKPCAVGEIGLHGPSGHMTRQVALLEDQLALARTYGLPVILHQHGAHNEMVRVLKRVPPVAGGVVHAFSGSESMGQEYLKAGLHLGIGGVITYPRAAKTRRAVAALPLSSMLLETDGPDMPLCGFQGARNTPAQIPAVFRSLCQLQQAEPTQAASTLEASATALFFG